LIHANISAMKPKDLYLALCIVGVVVPYAEFLPWLAAHGMNLHLFVQELLATRISAFFGADVIVSAVVVAVFGRIERRRLNLPLWWTPIVALFCVGVSLALPLLLYLREVAAEKAQPMP
jgi:hypothetical protein